MCPNSIFISLCLISAACPPDNVTASLDCTANEAQIAWHDKSNVNSFTATAVDQDQGLLSCSSTTPSCRVPNLKCGTLYTVTVRHHDGICPSIPSEAIYLESGRNICLLVICVFFNLTMSFKNTYRLQTVQIIQNVAFQTPRGPEKTHCAIFGVYRRFDCIFCVQH